MEGIRKINKIVIDCPHCRSHEIAIIKIINDNVPLHLKNTVSLFVNECCFRHPQAETSATELYKRFQEWWFEKFPNEPITQKKFGNILGNKFECRKYGTYRYLGIGLLSKIKDYD